VIHIDNTLNWEAPNEVREQQGEFGQMKSFQLPPFPATGKTSGSRTGARWPINSGEAAGRRLLKKARAIEGAATIPAAGQRST
jgi:hypothetical protein